MEAIENSGLNMEEEDRDRVGVIVSSGIGGLQELEDQIIRMHERGMKRIQPMFIPKALSNMGAGNIALKIGAQGVCKSVTTACASANDAIGEAFREIKFGDVYKRQVVGQAFFVVTFQEMRRPVILQQLSHKDY